MFPGQFHSPRIPAEREGETARKKKKKRNCEVFILNINLKEVILGHL